MQYSGWSRRRPGNRRPAAVRLSCPLLFWMPLSGMLSSAELSCRLSFHFGRKLLCQPDGLRSSLSMYLFCYFLFCSFSHSSVSFISLSAFTAGTASV